MNEAKGAGESSVNIKSRKEVSVSGINSISGFGEDYVILETECGRLEIEGEEMRIESLSKEEGIVCIKGKVNSLYYSQPKSSRKLPWGKK